MLSYPQSSHPAWKALRSDILKKLTYKNLFKKKTKKIILLSKLGDHDHNQQKQQSHLHLTT